MKPRMSRLKREEIIMGLCWKCSDGINSGIANNPQDAYEAWKSARAETMAMYPWCYKEADARKDNS